MSDGGRTSCRELPQSKNGWSSPINMIVKHNAIKESFICMDSLEEYANGRIFVVLTHVTDFLVLSNPDSAQDIYSKIYV